MPRYQVSGLSSTTGRKRTRIYEVLNQDAAVQMAASEGITADINSITILPDPPPTESQIEYAKTFNIKITKEITKRQLSALLTQAEDEEWPTKAQLQKAKKMGITVPNGITCFDLDDLIDEKEEAIEEKKDRIREQKEDDRFFAQQPKFRKTKKSSKPISIWMVVLIVIVIAVLLKSCD